ncbi:MAG: hypothetical protein JXA44_03665 [Methanospirillaceae archaeon]|nr:hypothetical protein [Methanospirillaceae archaeon]
MIQIRGTIITTHENPECVAAAVSVDNLPSMVTSAENGCVKTAITSSKIRSMIASVDDYLVNLALAEELCR